MSTFLVGPGVKGQDGTEKRGKSGPYQAAWSNWPLANPKIDGGPA